MPNYIITTKANFKPFSYDELLSPVLMATKEHREIEDAYGDLESKANVWERLANSPQDKEVYNIYKNYSKDLSNAADSLAKEGLTPTSRRELSKLKARYSSDITPIEDAYNRREQDRTNYKQALMKDPTLMSSSNPNIASLSAYMGGKQPTYHNVSGNDLYKRGAAASKASSLRRYSGTSIGHALGMQYFKLTKTQGYSPTEAALFLADANNIPELKEAINRISNEYNVNALEDKERAVDYIISGIMDGMTYKEEDDYKKDDNFISAYQREVLNNAKNKGKDDTPDPEYTYRPTKLKTDKSIAKDRDEAIKLLSDSRFNSSFKDGKLNGVETVALPVVSWNDLSRATTPKEAMVETPESKYVSDIRKLLQNNNYSISDINNMNSSEIRYILNALANEDDLQITRDALRIDLDDTATKSVATWDSDQYDTVETFSGGLPVKGKRSKISIDDDEQGKILIDNEGPNPSVYLEVNSGTYDITKQLTSQERWVLQKNSTTITSNRKRLQEIEEALESNKRETLNEIYEAQALTLERLELQESIEQAKQSTHNLVRNTITSRNKIINNAKN